MYTNAKAQQIAAGFLSLAPSRTLTKLALIKLMYIADRTAIAEIGATISGDVHFSLPQGPILSKSLNAMRWSGEGSGPWEPLIKRSGNNVLLTEPVSLDDLDELSDAEAEIIARVSGTYGALSAWQLRNLSHDFPEWRDPHGSSLPIAIEDIARAVGLAEDEIAWIVEQQQVQEQADRALVAR